MGIPFRHILLAWVFVRVGGFFTLAMGARLLFI